MGTIYIESDLQRLQTRIREYSVAFIATPLVTLLLALLIAPRLRRPISAPLSELLHTAESISKAADYSIRARFANTDEFGQLVVAFNGMLDQTESQDHQLRQHREHLEEKIAARTAGLFYANAQLTLQAEALKAASNSIMIADLNGTIVWTNSAFTVSSGYSSEEVVGKNPRLLNSGEHDRDFYARMWATITSGKTWRGELEIYRRDHTKKWVVVTMRAPRDSGGNIGVYEGMIEDITDRRVAEERVHFLAYYDALTGLPNRILLHDSAGDILLQEVAL